MHKATFTLAPELHSRATSKVSITHHFWCVDGSVAPASGSPTLTLVKPLRLASSNDMHFAKTLFSHLQSTMLQHFSSSCLRYDGLIHFKLLIVDLACTPEEEYGEIQQNGLLEQLRPQW